MHRISTQSVRRPLLAFVALLVMLAPAFGAAQSSVSGVVTVRVTLDDGTVVAAGDLDDGRLDVEILPGLAGFGNAEFVLADGTVVSGDVTFGEDGQVTVFAGDFSGTLEEFLAGYATEVTVEIDDSIDDPSGDATGPSDEDHDEDGNDQGDDLNDDSSDDDSSDDESSDDDGSDTHDDPSDDDGVDEDDV